MQGFPRSQGWIEAIKKHFGKGRKTINANNALMIFEIGWHFLKEVVTPLYAGLAFGHFQM